jgi:hypothetical protein
MNIFDMCAQQQERGLIPQSNPMELLRTPEMDTLRNVGDLADIVINRDLEYAQRSAALP